MECSHVVAHPGRVLAVRAAPPEVIVATGPADGKGENAGRWRALGAAPANRHLVRGSAIGSPRFFPTGAGAALDAAIVLQQEVRRFNDERAREHREPIVIGIGVHYGRVMLGTIGETERIETTVIADAVNVASRLEGMTKIVGVPIVTSEALVAALEDRAAFCLRPNGEVVLRGRGEATEAFEVYDGDPHDLLLHKHRSIEEFELGLSAYRDGDCARGPEIFDRIAQAHPQDSVAA